MHVTLVEVFQILDDIEGRLGQDDCGGKDVHEFDVSVQFLTYNE